MIALIDTFKTELLDVAAFQKDTVQNYISCILKYCEYLKDDVKLDPIKHGEKYVSQWFLKLKEGGISKSRLNHHQSALKGFFDFLVKMKVMKNNPIKKIVTIRKGHSELNQPIPTETAFRLLDIVGQGTWIGKRNYLIISLLWALGLRISELVSLRVGSFKVHDHSEKIGTLRIKGKNKKERVLFVVDKLYTTFTKYLAHKESPKMGKDFLFPGKKNSISTDRVQSIIKEYAKKAGIEQRITPHVLRHSFATEMYHNKVPLEAIRDMMGHGSIAETSLYIHVSEELKKNALEHITITGEVSWKK